MPSTDQPPPINYQHQKLAVVATATLKYRVRYCMLSKIIVYKLRIGIKIQCNKLSTEIYSIYCSRARDRLPDFAEERQKRSKTCTNCDGKFHWCHRPAFPPALPTPFGGRRSLRSIWIPRYIWSSEPAMVTSLLVTVLCESGPEIRICTQWHALTTPDYRLLVFFAFWMGIVDSCR